MFGHTDTPAILSVPISTRLTRWFSNDKISSLFWCDEPRTMWSCRIGFWQFIRQEVRVLASFDVCFSHSAFLMFVTLLVARSAGSSESRFVATTTFDLLGLAIAKVCPTLVVLMMRPRFFHLGRKAAVRDMWVNPSRTQRGSLTRCREASRIESQAKPAFSKKRPAVKNEGRTCWVHGYCSWLHCPSLHEKNSTELVGERHVASVHVSGVLSQSVLFFCVVVGVEIRLADFWFGQLVSLLSLG